MTNSNDDGDELLGRNVDAPQFRPEDGQGSCEADPGLSVSVVARRSCLNGNQLSKWRNLYQGSSLATVSAREVVVATPEMQAERAGQDGRRREDGSPAGPSHAVAGFTTAVCKAARHPAL